MDKPDLTNLEIVCPCKDVTPIRMLCVRHSTPVLADEFAVYQCSACGKQKKVTWKVGVISDSRLTIVDL